MITVSCPSLDRLPDPEEIVQALEDLETEAKNLRKLLRAIRDREITAKERARRPASLKEAERVA